MSKGLASALYEARIDAAVVEYGRMLANPQKYDERDVRTQIRQIRAKTPELYGTVVPKRTVKEISSARGHFTF